jgi:hypothetical protein
MADVPGETVLEEAPTRALAFLRGIAKYPQIQAVLAPNGYTKAQHDEGWRLTLAAIGAPSATEPAAPVTTPAHQAMLTLDAWDERGFARIDAALETSFPEQHAFVFAGGLTASVGPAAVAGVQTMLTRLDALASGEGRPAGSRKKDQAAIARLAERGIDEAQRERLAALAKQAVAFVPTAAPVDDSEHQAALLAVYFWHREWAKTARAVITKRAYLISLGLAKRKSGKKTPAIAPTAARLDPAAEAEPKKKKNEP